jgi:predicted aldo/keto reductase-like oxidoreductase
MKQLTRRHFIGAGLTGTAILSSGVGQMFGNPASSSTIDQVDLGKTGLKISRLALGLGTNGWKHQSNQTRIGMEKFISIAHAAYDRGIRFFDTADTYGSHICVNEALKFIPREKVRIMSKIWTDNLDWHPLEPVSKILDRIRKEIGTDYLDIVLLHCMTDPNWTESKKKFMDDLNEAKQKGIVKKVGFSAHDFNALKNGILSDWPDVVLSRINPVGSRMDAEPAKVMPLLEQAKNSGKGVIGMKIFGCGDLTGDEDREKSLNYVLRSGNVHTMTIGFESVQQVNDAVDRIMNIVSSISK